jgi:hypothetical protein
MIAAVRNGRHALAPSEFLVSAESWARTPGLYSWWVDQERASDLSAGLGHPVAAGLIYAGQAGATRWPSGRRSANTLWTRIGGMHLGGRAEFSTFRRTLAAILRQPLGLADEDDTRLSEWMARHLRVLPVPVSDGDALGALEAEVLDALDPPLNLRGRPVTTLRALLSTLRTARETKETP